MEERYCCRLVTDLILTRKNQDNGNIEILLALRKNTGYHDGEYELPGGHVESGEDLMHAMIREAKEELLIDIDENDLRIVHVMHDYTGDRVNFILTAENYKGTPQIGETDKCERIGWFYIKDLPMNTMPKVKKIIEYINNGIFYSKR